MQREEDAQIAAAASMGHPSMQGHSHNPPLDDDGYDDEEEDDDYDSQEYDEDEEEDDMVKASGVPNETVVLTFHRSL